MFRSLIISFFYIHYFRIGYISRYLRSIFMRHLKSSTYAQMTSSIRCIFEFDEMKNDVNDVLMILITNEYMLIIESQTSNYPRMVNIIKIKSTGYTSMIFSYRFPDDFMTVCKGRSTTSLLLFIKNDSKIRIISFLIF